MKTIISLNKKWLLTVLVFSSLLVTYKVSANSNYEDGTGDTVTVKTDDCNGCGECVGDAVDIFGLSNGVVYIKRQPKNYNEREMVHLAIVNCPFKCISANFD